MKQKMIVIGLFLLLCSSTIWAQAEVQAWGNITGIRTDGQMHRFESSLCLVGKSWSSEWHTGKEKCWSRFQRENGRQKVLVGLDSLFATEVFDSQGDGAVQVKIDFELREETAMTGLFYHIRLPAKDFENATITQLEPAAIQFPEHEHFRAAPDEILRVFAKGLSVETANRNFRISTPEATTMIIRSDEETGDLKVYVTLQANEPELNQMYHQELTLQTSGTIDDSPVDLQLYTSYPGNSFLGFGGNFRLQNLKNDPQVIDYCLNNMEVRMGRVEIPWEVWHPVDSINPYEAAMRGDIHPRVKLSMEMAKRLSDAGMPVLLAGWFPPQWAAQGIVGRNPRHPDGSYGWPLREDRQEDIYASIGSYILYLKEVYGVEIAMFSFNESDLGINVRQTAKEHAALIKGLGAYLKSKGLNTKLLLGDTADANGYPFVDESLNDPETWEYIGAVSFHSWRGCDDATLTEWYEAADRINVPLIVGEGSIDAAAWRYPQVFTEAHYAMEEIKLYIRMLAICQPQTILQWQLTSDYSPMIGGGIFGNEAALVPTQRFWNLKQLASTPENLHYIPVTHKSDDIYVAALTDRKGKNFALHVVNDGSRREVNMKGLPERIKQLGVYVTDETRSMEKIATIPVVNGRLRFEVDPASFVSLMSE